MTRDEFIAQTAMDIFSRCIVPTSDIDERNEEMVADIALKCTQAGTILADTLTANGVHAWKLS